MVITLRQNVTLNIQNIYLMLKKQVRNIGIRSLFIGLNCANSRPNCTKDLRLLDKRSEIAVLKTDFRSIS